MTGFAVLGDPNFGGALESIKSLVTNQAIQNQPTCSLLWSKIFLNQNLMALKVVPILMKEVYRKVL